MEEDVRDEKRNRQQNDRDSKRVARAVYGMLMACRVLRNPLLMTSSARHAEDDSTINPQHRWADELSLPCCPWPVAIAAGPPDLLRVG